VRASSGSRYARSALTAVVAVVAMAACTSPTPIPEPPQHDGTNDVGPVFSDDLHRISDSGGTIDSLGVRIEIPDGAIASGEEIAVRVGPDLGNAPGPLIAEWVGAPVEVEHDSELQEPITLTWNLDDVPPEQLGVVYLVRWDEQNGTWARTHEPVTVEGNLLSAQVREFSIITWISNAAAEVSQISGQVFGGRAAAPTCSGAVPDWVQHTIRPDQDLSAAALRVCFESDPSDNLVVRIVNNRPYVQVVQFETEARPAAIIPTSPALLSPLALSYIVGDDDVVIPPTSEIAVTIPRPREPGSAVFRGVARVDALTIAADIMAMVADSIPLGEFDNPAVNAAIQAIFECGGATFAEAALRGGVDEAIIGDIGRTLISCAQELVRPGSDLGVRFEQLSRDLIARGVDKHGLTDASYVLRANRAAHSLALRAGALQLWKVTQYASELFVDSQVGPTSLSFQARGVPGPLGTWSAVCDDLEADSTALYKNLTSQDEFADTSREFWEFPGWADASAHAVQPLTDCSAEYRLSLSGLLPTDWGDTTAAHVTADAIRFLDGLGPLTHNQGLGVAELPEGAAWLYSVSHDTSQDSGDVADVAIASLGEVLSFPNSTAQWVGCAGTTSRTVFEFDEQFATMSVAFGLRDHTPEALTAHVVIRADEKIEPLLEENVTYGEVLQRRELDVTGVRTLTVEVATDDGCTSSATAYGAFLDTWVR
jgi:hypothetical protein